ncbi:MAG TPA: alpha-glucan family phosphorylase [Anaerolineales bacterium]|nr:alpha-glucan family phosphorylase [Anaerolineales bacterium]
MIPIQAQETTSDPPGLLAGVSLPRRIGRLSELALNLWWSWHPEAQELFKTIEEQLWIECYHNPVKFLRNVKRKALNAAIHDKRCLEFYDRTMAAFDAYMRPAHTWYSRAYPDHADHLIAYFSTEFGLHESFPTYAGGLGVLSGDHAKEASDLGLPFVGVGFLYNQGYFSQHITEDGWQEAGYRRHSFDDMPVIPLLDAHDKPLLIKVDLPGRALHARLWKIQVGRVPLILLDSDVPENAPNDRDLTARVYGGDLDTRISQEIALGIGGVQALRALGIQPQVWHMNEGHSAFMALERIRERVAQGKAFDDALAEVRARTIFTTHTPVAAGNEEFPDWLMDRYFGGYWGQLGLDREKFMDLARHTQSWGQTFSMSILALRLSHKRNGVSELHGQVSRKMWQFLFPETPVERVPITAITNGVHTGTWLARRMKLLYDRYLGPNWMEDLDDHDLWQSIFAVPDEELWVVRRHLKRKLVAFARERARAHWLSTSHHPVQIVAAGVLLDPYALTIGFARRFATYKRGSLAMRDPERLLRIVNHAQRPVQVIFAGKAHPMDEPGKLIIQQVYRTLKRAEYGGRIVFLEDYDMNLARYLVQGVDVWMNNPRRPLEASGTSGMKAALNGVLNFSVLDGWWQEGYNGDNGWAISDEAEFSSADEQDAQDAASLYDVLENQIVPLYYENGLNEMSPGWMRKVKESISTLAPQFSTRRMVKQYVEEMYLAR